VGPYDARDAIEACAGLWGDEKEECYAIFGVDPAADIWVDVVFSLEHALELETGKPFPRCIYDDDKIIKIAQ